MRLRLLLLAVLSIAACSSKSKSPSTGTGSGPSSGSAPAKPDVPPRQFAAGTPGLDKTFGTNGRAAVLGANFDDGLLLDDGTLITSWHVDGDDEAVELMATDDRGARVTGFGSGGTAHIAGHHGSKLAADRQGHILVF